MTNKTLLNSVRKNEWNIPKHNSYEPATKKWGTVKSLIETMTGGKKRNVQQHRKYDSDAKRNVVLFSEDLDWALKSVLEAIQMEYRKNSKEDEKMIPIH